MKILSFVGMLSLASLVNCGVSATPQGQIHSQYDKFAGTMKTTADIELPPSFFEPSSMPSATRDVLLERAGTNPYVTISYKIAAKTSELVVALQHTDYGIAANDAPLPHEAPVTQPVFGEYRSNVTISTRVPIDEFKKLAAVTSFELKAYSLKEKFGDFELGVVREFAKRLE